MKTMNLTCEGLVFGLFTLVVGGVCGFMVGYSDGSIAGRRSGQIDALNGRIHYELIENDNGETTWQEVDNER